MGTEFQSEFLTSILESLPYPLYVFDAFDCTIKFANSAARNGRSITNQTTCYALSHRRDRVCGPADHQCPIETVKRTKQPCAVEHIHYDRDGNPRNIEIYSFPMVDDKGEIVHLVECCFDITERRRIQEALRVLNEELEERVRKRTKSLEEANEELKEFTYVVSHDLRAPLINIKGFAGELRKLADGLQAACDRYTELGEEGAQGQVQEIVHKEMPEALFYIEESITRMDRQINTILTLSRLGHQTLRFEDIRMDDLVERILKSLAHQVERQGVTITVQALPEVKADVDAMEQIMGNILDNAVKYLSPDRRGEITITGERTDGHTMFHIRDNGRGIVEENRNKVFMIFRRIATNDIPGEGVGLSFVQALVRRHGGKIWFESQPGAGTTFSFTVPNDIPEGKKHG